MLDLYFFTLEYFIGIGRIADHGCEENIIGHLEAPIQMCLRILKMIEESFFAS
jgi:hypothetical protein